LLLGIGPISQQAVNLTVCRGSVSGQQATIPVAFDGQHSVDAPLMGSIVNSLANPTQNQNTLVTGCSTGNCSFDQFTDGITHSTIGICSQCIDITSKFRNNSDEYQSYVIANGQTLDGFTVLAGAVDPARNASGWAREHWREYIDLQLDSNLTAIIPSSVLNWTTITLSFCPAPCNRSSTQIDFDEGGFPSTACSIYPCMKHYAGLVNRGEFSETLVSTVPAFPSTAEGKNYYAGINASCVIDGNTHYLTRIQPNQIEISQNGSVLLNLDRGNLTLSSASECINKIDSGFVSDVANFLSRVLSGNCTRTGCYNKTGEQMWWLDDVLLNSGNITLAVQSAFNSVVESITNRMRIEGSLVYGTVMQTTTCIEIHWRWLLFPASLTILTVICLVITMVQPFFEDVEKPLWKSSILPFLYASPGTQLMASGEVRDMEAKSKVTITRLENSEDKWSLVNISGERK
jgi:hypothetical protein